MTQEHSEGDPTREPLEPSDAEREADHTEAELAPETAEPGRPPARINPRTEIPFGLIVFLIIAVLLVVFTVQNSNEDVTIRFLPWEGSYPLALIIIGVVAVTVILDEVLGLFLRRRRRRRLAEKQELERLREQNR